MSGGYLESVAIIFGINVLLAFSLYFPMTAGLISLGQSGFMAIGAYASAMLTKAGTPFPLALLAGGAAAAVAGLLVGAPALRIRGMYLIILTLGFGEIVRVFFLNFEPTGAVAGLGGIEPYTTLPAVLAACVVCVLLAIRLRRLRLGHAMQAIHEDEVAATTLGVNAVSVKLMSFAIGATIAGIAGAFYAHYALYIDSAQFGFMQSANAFLFLIIGGPTSALGPAVGAAVATLLPEAFRILQEWRMTFFGLVLVVLSVWRPNGLLAQRGHRS